MQQAYITPAPEEQTSPETQPPGCTIVEFTPHSYSILVNFIIHANYHSVLN